MVNRPLGNIGKAFYYFYCVKEHNQNVKSGHFGRTRDLAMIKSGRKIIALIILFISIIFGNTAYAQSGSWKVSESQGDVSILHQGVTKVAVKGAALSAGDSIKTGANGRAVITRGEQYVVVSRNSHIKVAPQEAKSILTQFVQYFGNALFKVDKRKDQHFAVETPYMAAVVKGTTFNVSVGDEGATVQVTEGAVEVATLDGGARELLLPGDIGLVERGDTFSLGIRGRNSRNIESPNKPAGQTAPAVKAAPAITASAAPAISEAVPSTPAIKEVRVASVNLAGLTDGLIEGNSPGVEVDATEDTSSSDSENNDNGDQSVFNAVTAVNTNADLSDRDNSADNGASEEPLLEVDMEVVAGDSMSDEDESDDADTDIANIVDDIVEEPVVENDLPENDGATDSDDLNDVTAPELPEPIIPDNEVPIIELPEDIIPGDENDDDGNGRNDDDGDYDSDDDSYDDSDDGNNGHGNDDDGNDESNPGNGNGRNDNDRDDDNDRGARNDRDDDDDRNDRDDDDRNDRDDDDRGGRNDRDDDDDLNDRDDDDDDREGPRCRTLACGIIREILD